MNDKVLSMLGMAKKAGKTISGTSLVSTFVRSENKPSLVLMACDASDNTQKLLDSACRHHKVVYYKTDYSMDEISNAIGASYYIACVAIMDRGFAEGISQRLAETTKRLTYQEV